MCDSQFTRGYGALARNIHKNTQECDTLILLMASTGPRQGSKQNEVMHKLRYRVDVTVKTIEIQQTLIKIKAYSCRKNGFVLLVVEIPQVDAPVQGGREEHAGACWRPTRRGKIRRVVQRVHDGRLEVLTPNLTTKEADIQSLCQCRIFRMGWV